MGVVHYTELKRLSEILNITKAVIYKKAIKLEKYKLVYQDRRTQKIGTLSKGLNGFTTVKIGKGQWVLFHRVLWERMYGKIAKNHVISFKDGNKENISIFNLEVLSSGDFKLKNSLKNYPDDLIEIALINRKLGKMLNVDSSIKN